LTDAVNHEHRSARATGHAEGYAYDVTVALTEPLTLVPLTGPWHLRHPRWNVVSVRDALAALAPVRLWTTALSDDYAADSAWQGTDEVALPWTLAGWAAARNTPLHGLAAPGAEEGAAFDRTLAEYPQARAQLDSVRLPLRPLHTLLPQALDLPRIVEEVIPPLAAAYRARQAAFGEGPGTAWRARRSEAALGSLLAAPAPERPGPEALLVEVDLWPALVAALDATGTAWRVVGNPPVSDAARSRSLLDVAWHAEARDVAGLLQALRELDLSEARYLEANLLLAHDHAAEALEVLERAAAGDFRDPYLLPGLLLARLGQLRDLAGKRERAMQAYRGVLALAWAPAEARAAAQAGLRKPFGLTPGDPA